MALKNHAFLLYCCVFKILCKLYGIREAIINKLLTNFPNTKSAFCCFRVMLRVKMALIFRVFLVKSCLLMTLTFSQKIDYLIMINENNWREVLQGEWMIEL